MSDSSELLRVISLLLTVLSTQEVHFFVKLEDKNY